MNATPRLSGLQKRGWLQGPRRFSARQASCRLPFALSKEKPSIPPLQRRHPDADALLFRE